MPLGEENEYILDLKQRMAATCDLVAKNLRKANLCNKKHFDHKVR